jgi:hypothetical protein
VNALTDAWRHYFAVRDRCFGIERVLRTDIVDAIAAN